MPIYEFYCSPCHTIYSFLSRVPSDRAPRCPRCGREELERRASSFAISKGRPESAEEDGFPDLDDARMEAAVEALAGEAESLDENDPRQVAALMRKFYSATGLGLDGPVEEAIRRMEAGEDPEKIEQEMGDALENADPFAPGGSSKLARLRRRLPPSVDRTLYEM